MKVSAALTKILNAAAKEVSKWKPWQRTNVDPFAPKKKVSK